MGKKPKKFYKKAKVEESREKKKITAINSRRKVSSKNIEEDNGKGGSKQAAKTKKESPKNNRSITEGGVTSKATSPQSSSKRKGRSWIYLVSLLSIIALLGIIWMGGLVKEEYKRYEKVDAERKQIQTKFDQLQQTAIAHPGSRDIYLQLAVLSYQLSDLQKAKGFTERVLTFDPNFEQALTLRKKLSGDK